MLNATPEAQKSAIFPAVIGAQDWPNAQKISKIALATLPPEIQKIYAEEDEEIEIPQQVRAILEEYKVAMSESEQEASALMEQVQALTEQNKMLAQDLQTTLLSKEQESQSKVSVALINAQSDLEVARINAGSKNQSTIIDSATKLELEQVKQDGESNRKQMDIATDIIGKAISGTQTAEIARPDGVGFPVSAGTLP
jgi:YbbR domain-containing protein